MKKILLVAVNAKYIHSNLAVYSLRAAAGTYADQIEIAEYTINQQPDQVLGDIYRRQPDVVAFSCYIWNGEMIGELLQELHKVLPQAELWAGGPEVSYDAPEFLKRYPKVRGVMRAEGERSFPELASYYIEETGSLDLISGITYRKETGELRENPWAEPVNMDEIPFVYEDLKDFNHKIIYYESSRGCPFRCSYCLSSIDKRVRFRSLPLVKKELQIFLDAQVPQVKFVDRTFNCNPKRTVELLNWIQEHDNGVTNFHFEIAADITTEEELAIMEKMRPGLIQLEIGVQSTNPKTVEAIHRTMDLTKLKKVVDRVKSFGNIHQHLDLIAGLPYEDVDSFQKSFDDVYAMKPDQLQLGFLKVLKGSGMRDDAPGYGISWHERAPYEVLTTDWLSYGDVLLLKGVEDMVEVYYNSRQFDRTIEKIMEQYASPFLFFKELADFYDREGLAGIGHARIARYEILRRFISEEKGWDLKVYDQCMVLDLYARENLKSRPAFAPDLSPYKEQLKAMTREYGRQVHVEVLEQEQEPVYLMFDYRTRDPLTGDAVMQILEENK